MELNTFWPPNRRDDLCLYFCLQPSSMVEKKGRKKPFPLLMYTVQLAGPVIDRQAQWIPLRDILVFSTERRKALFSLRDKLGIKGFFHQLQFSLLSPQHAGEKLLQFFFTGYELYLPPSGCKRWKVFIDYGHHLKFFLSFSNLLNTLGRNYQTITLFFGGGGWGWDMSFPAAIQM